MDYELTIITICFNCRADLSKTVESINRQTISNFKKIKNVEHIIVDGASTDGTLDVANVWRNKSRQVDVSIISESDNGIYDAMNKGIRLSNGKWILLLNAGDTFHSEKDLESLLIYLESEKSDIVYANYYRVNEYGVRKTEIPSLNQITKTMIFCHQATIVQKKLYEEYLYDLSYKLVADYAFFLKSFLNGKTFSCFNYFLVDYDVNGESAKRMISTYKEIRKVRKDLLGDKLSILDDAAYGVGIVKRLMLSFMPQKFRWFLIKSIDSNSFLK